MSANTSAVSRALTAAGFRKSVSRPTRIKGWHDWNEGFTCEKGYVDGTVIVAWRMAKWSRDSERRSQKLSEVGKALITKGYSVELDESWSWPRLVVTR